MNQNLDTQPTDILSVIPAKLTDMDSVMELAVEFFYESDNRSMTLNAGRYRRYIEMLHSLPNTRILLAHAAKIPAGYTIIYSARDFAEESIGEMLHFYVRPEFRGMGVARKLRDAMIAQYDAWGTHKDFIEAASGVDGDKSAKLFSNLFKKSGFRNAGVLMVREK